MRNRFRHQVRCGGATHRFEAKSERTGIGCVARSSETCDGEPEF